MRSWETRSDEEANLLNPAFLSIIAYQCVKGYQEEVGFHAPYVLPFLVTPFILHKKTREKLPNRINTTFSTWISQPEGTLAKAGYAHRASSIVPYVKESLFFSFSHELLQPRKDHLSLLYNPKIKIPLTLNDQFSCEVEDCFKKSFFCGRWFARGGKIETVMALLGVKP